MTKNIYFRSRCERSLVLERIKISIKIINRKKSLLVIFFLVLLTSSFIAILSPVRGEYDIYAEEGELDALVVRDLEVDVTYVFSVTYNPAYYDFDFTLSIYKRADFTNRSLLVAQDTPGVGPESIIFTAPNDGDFFIGVYVNSGESGLATVTVIEQGTSIEKDIEFQGISILYSLWWLWAVMGGSVLLGIIAIIVWIGFVFVVIRKQKAVAIKARETGEALPRIGRKKNMCPFCRVKLPPESLVTCPYCGAPITEE